MNEKMLIKNLYDLDKTIAKPLLEKLDYPWEALPKIKLCCKKQPISVSVFTCNKFYTVACVFRKNIVLFVKRRGDGNTAASAAPSFVKYIDALYYKVVF